MSISNPDYRTEGSHKTIKFVLAASPGIIVGGPMYNIVFFIKSGWSGSTPLVLDVDEFYESAPPNKAIDRTISNGSVSIGTTSTTTTVPATAPATTKPGASTTKSGSTSTTQGAATTVVSTTGEQSTAVPVTVPVEEIIEVLGPDAGNWNNDIGSLNEDQKEIIKEHFADQGKPVEITPDGVYYVETTAPDTTAAESTSADENAGGSLLNSNTKKIIAVSVVGLILTVSFGVAYYFRKKKGTP
jgi:cobalamin biosynthesis Mg chelatase CobN